MKHLLPMIKKELRAYFYSPIVYVVSTVFLGLIGYFFYSSVLLFHRQSIQFSSADINPIAFNPTDVILVRIFRSMGVIFILLTPIITMRLVAEERRATTMELLMTSPLSLTTIIAGKYIASLVVYLILIFLTLPIPFVIEYYSAVKWGHIFSAYTGLTLTGMAMFSVGLLCSSLTEKQVISAILCMGILALFWFVGGVIGSANPAISESMRYFSLFSHFENMINGLLDMRDILYLLSFTAFSLFLTYSFLDTGRWR